ncbi:response regulator [Methanoplanus endosymbiosus]|uniref:histidine kinase n=1 Tax=Methanoplanus endosymbiosus TaxID=33865 RepID=A0A9E7TLN4_9EURY|nr:PAS domain S-box protein [Methanoplanus endosymbiosus]UUX92551.1 PAS domain S-box protein [Methanoplanus endosymbiosus]
MADSDNKISLLYVDDEAVLLDIMKAFISRSDEFRLDTANCAAEGLIRLNTNHYDAVISDYQMPEMDGIELLTEIRNSGNNTPFILYTGKGREEVAIQALNAGADYYLQKGVNPRVSITELQNFIRHAVSKNRAEKTVREQERKMADVMNFLPDATFAIDKSGKVIAWNRAMEKITGISAGDILGKDSIKYSLPFYGERRPFLIEIVLNKNLLQDSDYFILYPEDEKIIAETFAPELYGGKGAYIRCTASVLYGSDGEVRGAIESIRDISDEKSAEKERAELTEKLREQKSLIDAVFDVTPVNFYVYEEDMKFRYVCTKGAEQLGMKPEEMTGRTWRELGMPAELLEPLEEKIMQVFSTGKVISARTIYPTVLGNRYYQYELSPIFNINGAVETVVSTAMDITGIVEAENEIQQKDLHFRDIIDNINDIFYRVDENGSITLINNNTPKILGYKSTRDMIGIPVEKIWAEPEKRKNLLEIIHETGSVSDYDIQFKCSDGSKMDVSLNSHICHDKNGNFCGIEGIARDISLRKSAENEREELLEKLSIQTRLINTLLDVTPVNFYVYDIDLRFKYVSPKGAEQMGMTAEEMTGKTWRELKMQEKYLKPLVENIISVFESGEVIKGKSNYHTINGFRNYIYELSPIPGDNGEVELVSSTVVDITGIKETEELYKTVFENTGTAMLIIKEDLSILDYNEELKRITGYDDEYLSICTDASFLTVKEDLSRIIEYHNLRKSDPESVPKNYELKFTHKDGSIKTAIINVAIIPDVNKYVVSIQDITDARHYETELKRTRDTLNFAIDGTKLGLWDRNLITNEIFHNDNWAEMFGYNSHEIKDDFKFWKENIHPKDLPHVYQAHKDHLSGKNDIFDVVCRMKYRDGSWRWINSKGKVVAWDSNWKATRMIGLNTDITHLKETEEALRQANDKLSLLSSITRHDTFNKITGILLSIELLKVKLADTDLTKKLEYIEDLVDAISEELEFARDYEDIGNLGLLWQDVADYLDKEKIPEGIFVRSDLTGIEILADPMLGKVVHNLVDNAVRHGNGVTKITVTHKFTPKGLLLVWEDDGTGILEGLKERIFERGFGSNTGLGLYLVREILSISGISIRETGAEGEGARFEISVPEGWYRNSTA